MSKSILRIALPTLLLVMSSVAGAQEQPKNDDAPVAAEKTTTDTVVRKQPGPVTPLTVSDGTAGLLDLNGATTNYTASGVFSQALTTAKPNVSVKLGTADATSSFSVFNSADANLLCVNAAKQIGVGTCTPASDFHLISSANGLRGITEDFYSDTANGGLITMRRARGTYTAPAAVQNGDFIGSLYTQAYDGTAWQAPARIRFVVDGPVSAGHTPSNIQFLTGDANGGTEHMRLTSGGWLGIGTAAPGAALHINGDRNYSQLYITDDVNSGLLSALTYVTDNESIGFDVGYWGGWSARYPTVGWITKSQGKLNFAGSGGNTPNTCCAAFNTYQSIDLTTGTSTFQSVTLPNTSTAITGGTIQLGGYPTKITWGNGQFIQDNASGNLRIFAGHDLSVDTSLGDIVLSPASAQTRVNGNLTATSSLTIGATAGDQTTRLTVHGGAVIDGNIAAKYQDVAEWVPASTEMNPGTVVVLNPEHTNEVTPSTVAYDTTVAGVVSAQPGVILGEAAPSKAQIATTGRVKVHVDASAAPIRVGDLLVTSGHSGVAMRSEPIDVSGVKIHRPGTLIGKALEPLASGQGDILVLLSLQ